MCQLHFPVHAPCSGSAPARPPQPVKRSQSTAARPQFSAARFADHGRGAFQNPRRKRAPAHLRSTATPPSQTNQSRAATVPAGARSSQREAAIDQSRTADYDRRSPTAAQHDHSQPESPQSTSTAAPRWSHHVPRKPDAPTPAPDPCGAATHLPASTPPRLRSRTGLPADEIVTARARK